MMYGVWYIKNPTTANEHALCVNTKPTFCAASEQ